MTKQDAKRFVNNLKEKAIENPMGTIIVAAAALTAVAKVMDANTQRGYQKAHTREIDRRLAMQAMKSR